MNKLDTLWYTHSPDPTGLGLAALSGRLVDAFRTAGTQIQALRESCDKEVREAHFDHHLSNSVRHGGNIPAIWARAEGRPTRLLAMSWIDEVQLIVTTPETGIKSIGELRNKRFGLPKWADVQIDFLRARALRGLENALRLEAMEVSDIELVDYPYGGTYSDSPSRYTGDPLGSLRRRRRRRNQELIGLLRGDIDAIYLKGAHGAQLVDEFGLEVIMDVGSHPDPLVRSNVGTPRTLTVDQHLIDHHPDAVRVILETLLQTERWAWSHPEETRNMVARSLNCSEYWAVVAYGADLHQRFHSNLDEGSIRSLQSLADFLARWGFTSSSFDIQDWIDPQPMQKLLRTVHAAS